MYIKYIFLTTLIYLAMCLFLQSFKNISIIAITKFNVFSKKITMFNVARRITNGWHNCWANGLKTEILVNLIIRSHIYNGTA